MSEHIIINEELMFNLTSNYARKYGSIPETNKQAIQHAYECGYNQGKADGFHAGVVAETKERLATMKEFEGQIKAEVVEEILPLIEDIRGLCRDDVLKDLIEKVKQLKEQDCEVI